MIEWQRWYVLKWVDHRLFWSCVTLCWVLQRVRAVEDQLLRGHQVRGVTEAYDDARRLVGERAIALYYLHGITDALPR